MPSEVTGKVRRIFTWVLRVLLGLAFHGDRDRKAHWNARDNSVFRRDWLGTVVPLCFRSSGYGRGALLIFVPAAVERPYGALIITCTVGLGTVLCFTMALFNPIFPLVMTLLAATLVWLAWRPKVA